jgi:hypothetical protein
MGGSPRPARGYTEIRSHQSKIKRAPDPFSGPGTWGGIGRLNEGSLHAAVKKWYAAEGDQFEQKVEGYIADIVRGDIVIEIQTGSFANIRRKLAELSRNRQVRLVYPIAKRKWILTVAPRTGDEVRRRRSPREGGPFHLFDELISIAHLIKKGNLSLDILLTEEEEVRTADGKGSWWRGGVSIVDHRLLSVIQRIELHGPRDFLNLLPREMGAKFTNRELAGTARIRLGLAQKATWCLRKMGALRKAGMRGREFVFARK